MLWKTGVQVITTSFSLLYAAAQSICRYPACARKPTAILDWGRTVEEM